ncbi:SIS domain-containing protein [Patescibacteria group bacterium]
MSQILNDLNKIKKIDSQNMRGSIEILPKQIAQVKEDFKKIDLPKFENIKNIVICGMGGSALGGHILKSLYFNELKIPVEIVNDYFAPCWVGKNTLCIISSYSGNTEEPLNAMKNAIRKKANVFGITSGGELAKMINDKKITGYVFEPKYNICGQPRMGLGYSIFSQLYFFKKIGILRLEDKKVEDIILELKKNIKRFGISNNANNIAKEIALSLHKHIPIFIASNFLSGSAHTFANQLNETSKNFSSYFLLPEAAHHLLDGLSFPKSNSNLKFFLIKSKLYYPENILKYDIMEKILNKSKIKFSSYECAGKDKLSQVFEVLALSSWTSFYLAILNKIDPSPVPVVVFFKREGGLAE